MAKYTKEAILQMAEEEDVEFIRLQFTDMFGMMKNMAITAGQLEKALNMVFVFHHPQRFLRIGIKKVLRSL